MTKVLFVQDAVAARAFATPEKAAVVESGFGEAMSADWTWPATAVSPRAHGSWL